MQNQVTNMIKWKHGFCFDLSNNNTEKKASLSETYIYKQGILMHALWSTRYSDHEKFHIHCVLKRLSIQAYFCQNVTNLNEFKIIVHFE